MRASQNLSSSSVSSDSVGSTIIVPTTGQDVVGAWKPGSIKDGLSLKIKNVHIHLYFTATQYLWNYALVEDIDNLTWSYILIIIYWTCQK